MNDHKKVAEIILSSAIDKDRYRIGNSKVFFRAGVLGYLEEVRDDIVNKLIRYLQGALRGHMRRKEYQRRLQQRYFSI
jgi:myosin heavy subunit